MVKCKFKVESKTETTDGINIRMTPVTHGSPENAEFFRYTPWGALEIGTINKEAAEQLQVGKDYYINITEEPLPDIDLLEKRNEDLNKMNRALQIIRENYEKKYGIRMFANGSERPLSPQDDPPISE